MTSIIEITECCETGIYKHPEWGKCSFCFRKENPEEYTKRCNFNPSYTNQQLKTITDGRKLPISSYLWTAIKEMCKTGEIRKETHFKDFIKFLKDNTNYKGWDADQGLELLKIYAKNQCDNDFKKINFKIQHAICGCIVDWWNIKKILFPGVSYCYYANWGNIPKLFTKDDSGKKELTKIPLPPGFKDWCEECKITKKSYCKECAGKEMFIDSTIFE
jgi:hypothetical protein